MESWSPWRRGGCRQGLTAFTSMPSEPANPTSLRLEITSTQGSWNTAYCMKVEPMPETCPTSTSTNKALRGPDFFTTAVTLGRGADHSLFDADGSAFIVHAQPDSYGAEAGAGERVACGVIEGQ